ncbi:MULTISPECIES: hypothetical protein [Streptomyces]|uniref:Uncharacterized protein n=1 Tax=Streptomyces chilikensis TaxID=1194079 RepID=A0ABV3EK78_9ACTN|nr:MULTISPECIES: hypothetical protein [Streptomyces]MDH6223069.1 hypothetical protein [Streptomyces sp. MJP52]
MSFLVELRGDHLTVAALGKGYGAAVHRIDLDDVHQQWPWTGPPVSGVTSR